MAGAAVSRGAAVSLREMSFNDHEQVTALTARHGLGARSAEEWRHVWIGNPAYRPGWTPGWVLETSAGEIVGSMANVPLGYEFEGRPIVAASGRGWVADPRYRGYAAFLLNELLQQKNVDLILNTTVNRHAGPAYAAFDSPRVPAGRWNESAFWITSYPGFARSALTARGWRFASALAWPAAVALRLRDLAGRANALRSTTRDYEVRFESGFDERFDAFWHELRRENRGLLLAVRNRATLAWHFQYHLQRDKVWILTASRNGRMLAYSIFYRKDKRDYGLKRVRLVDHQHLEGAQQAFVPMLAQALRRCRSERVHMLEDLGCAIEVIEPPHHRELPSWLFHYKANGRLAEALKDPAVWRPSLYDGDSSL
ncbi:MAG TPA: hypothetical protein VFA04_08505 [Bryobacteraceae bacterium]|nr:hypothetical protein [Bryobacteraceae bacterium]